MLSRSRARVADHVLVLTDAGIANTVLDGDSTGPGVRVATMHRVKGLEFTHVVVRLPGGVKTSKDPRDRTLVDVAATRCRKTLTVFKRS